MEYNSAGFIIFPSILEFHGENESLKERKWWLCSASKRLIIGSFAAPFPARRESSLNESKEVISLRAIACRVRGT